MKTFFALHEIASQRGDGLRSEIVRLLERARNVALVRACARPEAVLRPRQGGCRGRTARPWTRRKREN